MAEQAPGIFPHRQASSRGWLQPGTHGDGTFEPLKNLVAVKLRSDLQSVLVGVAMIPPPF